MAASCVVLHTEQKMPLIGLGTWKSNPGQVKATIKHALSVGYCHIDCVAIYGNETEIPESLKENVGPSKAVSQEEQSVISKLRSTKHHPEDVEPVLQTTLADLQLEYLDPYSIRWPYAFEQGGDPFLKNADGTICYDSTDDYKETWTALVAKELVRSLGQSNFSSRQINDLLNVASVYPALLQVVWHLYLAQNQLIAHCQPRGLKVMFTALWAPLIWRNPVLLGELVVLALLKKYSWSPAQILLRWQVQQEVISIPKSFTSFGILENVQIFYLTLTPEEMKQIDSLNKNWLCTVPLFTVDGKRAPRDTGHILYPFNGPYRSHSFLSSSPATRFCHLQKEQVNKVIGTSTLKKL